MTATLLALRRKLSISLLLSIVCGFPHDIWISEDVNFSDLCLTLKFLERKKSISIVSNVTVAFNPAGPETSVTSVTTS